MEVDNVSKSYEISSGTCHVLKKVSFVVNSSDKVGIIGRNGAGKTTLLRIIGGISEPDSGEVRRFGLISFPIGFSGGFQTSLTGFDNLRFICRLYNIPWQDKIDFVLNFTELGKYFYEPVKTYSSGMKARLAFAVSMVVDFDCYLIDEALSVGDERFKKKAKVELFEKKADKSFLVVSHSYSLIKKFCNRFFVLKQGCLSEFENIEEAIKYYESE